MGQLPRRLPQVFGPCLAVSVRSPYGRSFWEIGHPFDCFAVVDYSVVYIVGLATLLWGFPGFGNFSVVFLNGRSSCIKKPTVVLRDEFRASSTIARMITSRGPGFPFIITPVSSVSLQTLSFMDGSVADKSG